MATNESRKALTPEQELARRSRRSFIGLGTGLAGAAAGWYWLNTRPLEDEIPGPLRRVLGFNERVMSTALYSDRNRARIYPASAIGKLKVNGDIGIENEIDQDAWTLDLVPSGSPARKLTLDDIRGLPRHEEIIDFKCIEGWSTVTHFAGARFSEFTARFAPGSEK